MPHFEALKRIMIIGLLGILLSGTLPGASQAEEYYWSQREQELQSGEYHWYARWLGYGPSRRIPDWQELYVSVQVKAYHVYYWYDHTQPWDIDINVWLYLAWDYAHWLYNLTIQRVEPLYLCGHCWGEAEIYEQWVLIGEVNRSWEGGRDLYFYANISATSTDGSEDGWETIGYLGDLWVTVYDDPPPCGGVDYNYEDQLTGWRFIQALFSRWDFILGISLAMGCLIILRWALKEEKKESDEY